MTLKEALQTSGLETVDAQVLLSAILKKDRTWLFAHPDSPLTAEQEEQWLEWRMRRESGEPAAYIMGRKEFYGRYFHVDPSVLIPRPATEALVEDSLSYIRGNIEEGSGYREVDGGIGIWHGIKQAFDPSERMSIRAGGTTVADIGTGSGCIAITLALEVPDIVVIASDIDEHALTIARQNARLLGADERVRMMRAHGTDHLSSLSEPFMIVSNPPYIPTGTDVMKDVADFEPHHALFAGEQGMDVLKEIVEKAAVHTQCRACFLECRMDQMRDIEKIWKLNIPPVRPT